MRVYSLALLFILAGMVATSPLPTYDAANPLPLYYQIERSPLHGPASYTFTRDSEFLRAHHLEGVVFGEFLTGSSSLLTDQRTLLLLRDSIVYEDFSVDMRIRIDNIPTGDQYDNFDAAWIHHSDSMSMIYDLDKIYLEYRAPSVVTLGAGKRRYNWGPLMLGGLMLSDWNEGFFSIYQRYDAGPFSLQGMTAQLDSYTPEGGDGRHLEDRERLHRYISAARLSYEHERFSLALSQATVYAGVGRSWEIQYLFPFIPFHYAKMSTWRYANWGNKSLGSMDGSVRFLDDRVTLYGELLVDDLQQRKTESSKTRQNHLGRMAGLRVDDLADMYGFLEGGTITSFTYNHVSPPLRYLNTRGFIGSPLGPDTQLFWGRVGRQFPQNLSADVTWWLKWSGERRDLSREYPHPSVNNTIDDPIPYGVVEREALLFLRSSWNNPWGALSVTVGHLAYDNYENQEDQEKTTFFAGISLETALRARWE
ncbi:capsule assembly Wzi family protein [Chitinivibrio alkaliphilus]|uniref:Capsule assembly Wzi family protein n=1 Tax=Chitinivibrio alkaliphilus ACht1 TaxID=1313304 RepID=U7D3L0_9BACT|nr:capsule assembly Wzi family protein [Chitinivibrio alkaliphilus]ERP31089.1 hypothetical protein CALK_2050 [Chitinivibrio alkaliphilus ACht1]